MKEIFEQLTEENKNILLMTAQGMQLAQSEKQK